jgi:hypothetical protein
MTSGQHINGMMLDPFADLLPLQDNAALQSSAYGGEMSSEQHTNSAMFDPFSVTTPLRDHVLSQHSGMNEDFEDDDRLTDMSASHMGGGQVYPRLAPQQAPYAYYNDGHNGNQPTMAQQYTASSMPLSIGYGYVSAGTQGTNMGAMVMPAQQPGTLHFSRGAQPLVSDIDIVSLPFADENQALHGYSSAGVVRNTVVSMHSAPGTYGLLNNPPGSG